MTQETSSTAERITEELSYYTGTDYHFIYANPLTRETQGHYTDGVKRMAEMCGAYWLIDAVMSYQYGFMRREWWQTWTLTRKVYKSGVKKGRKYWTLTAEDGNGRKLASQKIPYSDFPLDSFKLFFVDGVLMLPSEH